MKKLCDMTLEELQKEEKRIGDECRKVRAMCLHFGNLEWKRNHLYKQKEKELEKVREEIKKRG